METNYYIISDAAKELHVEPHVLRYWEEELALKIPRNKMGHRIYGPEEMELFREVMRWKDEGLSLKEIQQKCNPSSDPFSGHGTQIIQYPSEKRVVENDFTGESDKMEKFKMILGRIVSDAIRDNATDLTSDIAGQVTVQVSKELDFLFRERQEADEERYRRLDETIRSFQQARQEAAAAQMSEIKTKKQRRRRMGKKHEK